MDADGSCLMTGGGKDLGWGWQLPHDWWEGAGGSCCMKGGGGAWDGAGSCPIYGGKGLVAAAAWVWGWLGTDGAGVGGSSSPTLVIWEQ